MRLEIWEWVLLGAAAYLAVLSLAGLMRRRRAELVAELTAQAVAVQNRLRAEEAREEGGREEEGESGGTKGGVAGKIDKLFVVPLLISDWPLDSSPNFPCPSSTSKPSAAR